MRRRPKIALLVLGLGIVFFSSRRRHTRFDCDWSSDVCSSDLLDESILCCHIQKEQEGLISPASKAEACPPSSVRREEAPLDGEDRSEIMCQKEMEIGRASCRGKSVDLGGRRIIKKKKIKRTRQ